MTSQIKLTAAQVPDDLTWRVVEITPDYRRSIALFGHHPNGEPIFVQRTESLIGEEILRNNEELRKENDGRRWSDGMGSDKGGNMPLVHISSTPPNVFYRDFAGRHGDRDFMKWWQAREENQPFRVRNGRV